MLDIGSLCTAECVDLSIDGRGIAKTEGRVIFVEDLLPGECAEIRITGKNKKILEAQVETRLQNSPERQPAPCTHFGSCGGCDLLHCVYSLQAEFKRKRVQDCLARICGLEWEVPAVLSVPPVLEYRNKASFPVRQIAGRPQVGYLSRGGDRLIPVKQCALIHPHMNAALQAFSQWLEKSGVSAYDPRQHTGLIRRFTVRRTAEGKMMASVEINGKKLPKRDLLIDLLANSVPQLAGISYGVNTRKGADNLAEAMYSIYGSDRVREDINGLQFDISMQTFLQVNHGAAELLYRTALDQAGVTEGMQVIDLYCGAGTITLQAAKRGAQMYGIEIVPPAIEDAKQNAKWNGIRNAEFICADAGKGFAILNRRGVKADMVILDPPRKGTDPLTIGEICKCDPKQILYISCDPATLARDIKLLMREGYAVTYIQPVDLFPQTSHIETIAVLKRDKKDA